MAARVYADVAEAFDFLSSEEGRVRRPDVFSRNVRHADLLSASPFRPRVVQRGPLLALAFLMVLGAVQRVVTCETCGGAFWFNQRRSGRTRRRREDGTYETVYWYSYRWLHRCAGRGAPGNQRHPQQRRTVVQGTILEGLPFRFVFFHTF